MTLCGPTAAFNNAAIALVGIVGFFRSINATYRSFGGVNLGRQSIGFLLAFPIEKCSIATVSKP